MEKSREEEIMESALIKKGVVHVHELTTMAHDISLLIMSFVSIIWLSFINIQSLNYIVDIVTIISCIPAVMTIFNILTILTYNKNLMLYLSLNDVEKYSQLRNKIKKADLIAQITFRLTVLLLVISMALSQFNPT